MRFLSVRADAFGPFAANETLTLAPGLNVVHGPNEAGKSSWHAALYAGLCGIRRGQGRPAVEDQLFANRHRPWGGGDAANWAVTTILEMQDGRRLELHHDLGSRTATIADPATGRPFQIDLINDGAPDGSRLLGLDRRAFVATACVSQAELLRVRESSSRLQEYLGKAVATGRDDATVVSAINAIERYEDDFVGTERAPTKPWRKARDAVTRLTGELQEAEHAHAAHLALIARGEDARSEAEQARYKLNLVLASQAAREADNLQARFRRAAELQPLFAAGAPPTALGDDELANSVAIALARWQDQPAEPRLTGSTAEQIRVQLEALPPIPEGELQPHAYVLTAWDGLKTAATAREQQAALEPAMTAEPDSGGLTEGELRHLSFDLGRSGEHAIQLGAPPPARTENAPNVPPAWLLGGGALVAALGLVLLLTSPLVGVFLLIIGLAAAAWGVVSRSKAESAGANVAQAEVAERMKAEESERLRVDAEARAVAAGLPADAARLQALAESIAAVRSQRQAYDVWAQRQIGLSRALADSEEDLRKALRGRGIEPGPDLSSDVASYETACRERQAAAADAGKRPGLQSQLEAREAAEKGAAKAAQLRQQAAQGVIDASAKCGLLEADAGQMVTALQAWMRQRELRLRELDNLRRRWTELSRLLDGLSLDNLDAAEKESRKAAEALARNLSANELAAVSLEPDVKAHVERLRQTYQTLAQTAAEIQGQIGTESGRVPSVPLAEEELAAARAELDRVARLRDTLNKTKQFLEVAQDRVNHDIAPVLNELVGRRLSQVTGGRYSEVRVDPEDLDVRVRLPDGTLKSAHLLSGGTAEQVYLLLRVAMAERLTKPDEVCPLILDDVTDQSDGDRTQSILETLHAISAERQIILFSQEGDVLSWAESTLKDSVRDQLRRLRGLAAPA